MLIAGGGADHLHGGAGRDRAVLPGTPEQYEMRRDGLRLLAFGPDGTVTMAGIELVGFDAAPDTVLTAEAL